MPEMRTAMTDSSNSNVSESIPTKRKHRPGLHRVQIACERCRSRKNKCDGKLPQCSTCKRAGLPCIVLDRVTNRQQPRAHVEQLEAENARLRDRIRELEITASASASTASTWNAELGLLGSPHLQAGSSSSIPKAPNVGGGQSLFSPNDGETNSNIESTKSDSQDNDRTPARTDGLFYGNVLQAVLLKADYKQAHGPPQSNYRLHVAPMSARSSTTAGFSNIMSLSLPPPELADKLQDTYFTYLWPVLPLIHRPSFLKDHYGPVMARHQDASDVSIFLTLIVFALGSIDLKRQDASLPTHHIEYFSLATQHYLIGLVASESIESVQGLLLMTVFAINEHQSINSWHCIGQAVRMAIDLGLHQWPSSTNCDLLESEMRKRVFWSAYALDRNISIALGRPCAVRDTDINMPLPQPYTDEELYCATSSISEPPNRRSDPLDMSTFIHTIKLRKIQSRIQDIFYPANAANCSEAMLALSRSQLQEELDTWIENAPRYFKPTKATFQSPDWFQIAYSHGLLLLHRPSPAASSVGPESLQICANAAITMIGSYSSLYAKNKVAYTWIALHSLFMASVTMLYTLWVSPEIRKNTRKIVVRSNVLSCLALFDVMSDYWPLARRCYEIIDRLGVASIALFDSPNTFESPSARSGSSTDGHFSQIDVEYMEWFGTRTTSRPPLSSLNVDNPQENGSTTETDPPNNEFPIPLVDSMDLFPDPYEWFHQGFDMTIPIMTNAFSSEPYTNAMVVNEMHDTSDFAQPHGFPPGFGSH